MTSRLLVDKIEGKSTSGTINIPNHIVQVVTHTYSTAFSWNSSGEVTTTSFSITPKTSTNKIHLFGVCPHYSAGDSNAWSATWTNNIFNGSTKVFQSEHDGIITGNVATTSTVSFNCPIATNATAGTTITITHKVNLTLGTATHQLNRSPRTTEFIVMEIAQ